MAGSLNWRVKPESHVQGRSWLATQASAWWVSGVVAFGIIMILTLSPLIAMVVQAGSIDWTAVLSNTYIQRVVQFSLTQALFSTALSLLFAIPVALALAHRPRFTGRTLIVNLFSLSLVIPTIVAIYGIVAVFGRTGWFNTALTFITLPSVPLYGLTGILIAHVFFNMPLATRVMLVSLESIPATNWRLAKQLGMGPYAIFRFIEWPSIKSQLPGLAVLIFTLCFTSFAIVMTLGGGPRATTIEVAIYQALRFDFDISLTVALAAIQLSICIALMGLSTLFRQDNSLSFTAYSAQSQNDHTRHYQRLLSSFWTGSIWNVLHVLTILLATMFVLLPLLALIVSSFNQKLLPVLADPMTIQALLNTTAVALISAVLSLTLAISLLISTRHLRIRLQLERTGQWLQLIGNVILVLPPLVLGTGLFLLLRPFADVFSLALVLVIIINSLMALPFVLRLLDAPIMQSANRYDRLMQSLGIRGWSRWRWIDWPQLRRPIALSLALATTLSAGDLSAIALFGSERVRTLPLLLYQRMGSYRLDEAAVTAGILLVLCLVLFGSIQRVVGGAKDAEN